MGGNNRMKKQFNNRELEDIRGYSNKHNEHIIAYIVFIMGELAERMTIKEVFNIIDSKGLEGLRYEYNKV
jgi:DNA polymerase/3'-5' exonuclease PolX